MASAKYSIRVEKNDEYKCQKLDEIQQNNKGG
jgi:hypothetical protein